MLRFTHGVGDNVPSLVPRKTFNIHQDTLQFDNSKSRVGVVELNSNLLWELAPSASRLLEASNNVVKRGSNPKVLLLQTQLFASLEIVIGIQYSTDGLGTLLIGDGAFVVAIVELLKVKLASRSLAGPETQVVGGGCSVTWNRNIVRDGLDNLTALPDGNVLAVGVGRFPDVAIKLNLWFVLVAETLNPCVKNTYVNSHIVTRKLPGVKVQPVVGNFNLISINNFLLEDAVAVAKAVAPGGVVERCQAVEEASGETAEATVSKGRIIFLGNDVFNSEPKIGKAS